MSARKRSTRKRAAKKPTRGKRSLAASAPASDAKIRHVVLLMLENRSFDQMLGLLQKDIPEIDGVPPGATRSNRDSKGRRYEQRDGAVRKVDPDPPHGHPFVMRSLKNGNAGFVSSFEEKHEGSSEAERQQVMCCYVPDELLSLHTLARQFVVCDAWHCSVPGPTWPNRLFAMSGTSLGRLKMPAGVFDPNLHSYDQPSVFRRLTEAKRSHRIYFGDFPLALLLKDRRSASAAKRFSRLKRFFADAAGPEPAFPEFAFLEPNYLRDANDDHPPHDVQLGQALVADVYDALRANEALWKSVLLVISYDEHGGFYDHVDPATRPTVAPDASPGEYKFDFETPGVRVPTILVSPWLDAQVAHDVFDHTSLLKLLQDLFGLGDLGQRTAQATSPLDALVLRASAREDTPERLPRPLGAKKPGAKRKLKKLAAKAAPAEPLNDHQEAIVAFSEYLEVLEPAPPKKRAALAKRKFRGPTAASSVAEERAVNFLRKKGAKL